jgi:adenylate kinase
VGLAERLGVPHIASGDLFRHHQQNGTPLGLKVREYINQGMLVPDEITIAMVLEQVLLPESQRGFILDGFPRNLAQAKALDDALAVKGVWIDRVSFIKVPVEELIKRLEGRRVCRKCQAPYHLETAPPKKPDKCDLCGGEIYQREDDTLDAVAVRLKVYQEETEPLVDYYNRAGRLVEVNGLGTVEEVGTRLHKALE